MTAATATAPATDTADQHAPLAGRLCWHAVEICRALDHGIAELQLAIAEAAEQTDALIELALAITEAGTPVDRPATSAAEGGRQ